MPRTSKALGTPTYPNGGEERIQPPGQGHVVHAGQEAGKPQKVYEYVESAPECRADFVQLRQIVDSFKAERF